MRTKEEIELELSGLEMAMDLFDDSFNLNAFRLQAQIDILKWILEEPDALVTPH